MREMGLTKTEDGNIEDDFQRSLIFKNLRWQVGQLF